MKLPKNLWPYGIIANFVIFISGTVWLVVFASSQNEDLVSANYYAQELEYQGQIDSLDRTKNLGSRASVQINADERHIVIIVPSEHAARKVAGRIELYRPSAAGLDREMKLAPDANGLQVIDARNLVPGLWKVRVSWTFENQNYLLDQTITNTAPQMGELTRR